MALMVMAWLAGCDRPAAAPPHDSSAAADAASAAKAPPPMAGVVPQPTTVPVSGAAGTGPAEGSTAVGGVAGHQDAGGAKPGGTPAPTGGDAAPARASGASS